MGKNSAIKSVLFASTFTDLAAHWFTSMPPRSVDSFDKLCSVFLKHLSYNTHAKKNPNALFGVPIKKRGCDNHELAECEPLNKRLPDILPGYETMEEYESA